MNLSLIISASAILLDASSEVLAQGDEDGARIYLQALRASLDEVLKEDGEGK